MSYAGICKIDLCLYKQVALSLLRTIAKDSAEQKHKVDLEKLLQPPEVGQRVELYFSLSVCLSISLLQPPEVRVSLTLYASLPICLVYPS
jgi:hypothetical protein